MYSIFHRKCHTCCYHFRNCFTFLSENVFYELYIYRALYYIPAIEEAFFIVSLTKDSQKEYILQRKEHSSSEKAFPCFLSFDKTIRDRSRGEAVEEREKCTDREISSA